jgi:cytochrome P450
MSAMSVPPGPKRHFLLGHLPEYGKDPLAFLTKSAREYGDIVELRFPPSTRVYLLSHPDYIEEVLAADNSHFVRHKGMRLRPTQRLLGNGLLTSEGHLSRSQRRLVLPAFHREQIVAYSNVMTAYTDQMLESWRAGQIRNVHQDMMRLTLEIVAKILFDADVTKPTGDIAARALSVLKDEFTAQRNSMRSLSAILALPLTRHARTAVRQLDGIISGIIRHRQRKIENTGDLLSLLLAARDEKGQPLTDQQLRDEAMTFFFAGHEATGLGLTWAWYLLAKDPEAEAKLRAELRAVLGRRSPDAADLPRLHYTTTVVKEALRLYPPAWAIGREALRDCVVGGYHVPAGTQLIMSQWITHRDPRYFDDPEKFHPDRWDGDLMKRLPKYAYFPYGGGARVCIGKAFAEMEMVLLLATIAQRFRLTLVSGHQVTLLPTFALVPKNGIMMVLTERR